MSGRTIGGGWVPTEADEQKAVMEWAEMMVRAGRMPELEWLFHIPNGGSRNKAEAGNLRAQGVKAGVPDLFLPVARGKYHGLFIEMKRMKGGRLSQAQERWAYTLGNHGYCAVVCEGFDEAVEILTDYLALSEGGA